MPPTLPRYSRCRCRRCFAFASRFPGRVDDAVGAAVHCRPRQARPEPSIKAGQTVALTAGSRGIANIPQILRGVVAYPATERPSRFSSPRWEAARRRHRVGPASPHRKLRHHRGVRRRSDPGVDGCRRDRQNSRRLARLPRQDRQHRRPHRRRRPHQGPHQLSRTDRVGLAQDDDDRPRQRREGAAWYHRAPCSRTITCPVVRSVSKVVRAKAPIAFGVATVENAYDEMALIDARSLPADFEPVEERLLAKSKEWLAKLPFGQADMLIMTRSARRCPAAAWTRTSWGRKRAFKGGGPPNQPEMRFIFVRELEAHARQRHRDRPRGLHHDTAGEGSRLCRDPAQLGDQRVVRRGRTCRSISRQRPRGADGVLVDPRHARSGDGTDYADPQHDARRGGSCVAAVPRRIDAAIEVRGARAGRVGVRRGGQPAGDCDSGTLNRTLLIRATTVSAVQNRPRHDSLFPT